jgi:hypothetical protein
MNYNKKYFRDIDKLHALEQAWNEKREKDPDYRALMKQSRKVADVLKKCPHEETMEKYRYFDGSYYNKAQTDYWTECVLCRKILSERTEIHSHYG